MLNGLSSPLLAEETFPLLVWKTLTSQKQEQEQKQKQRQIQKQPDKGVCTGKVPGESHFLEQNLRIIEKICLKIFFSGLLVTRPYL